MTAADSGRNTLRIACASHFSGKKDANTCIHLGKLVEDEEAPDVNCRTRTIGATMAEAPRPFFGTTEKAMPSRVHETRPRRLAHRKVNHWRVVLGSEMS